MMDDEQIFLKAIELPADACLQYVNATCSDDIQRSRVERLIAAHQRPDSLLADGEQMTMTVDSRPITTGVSIGPYKLREQIGEGGMGVVYVAEQDRPVKRKVALKLIKAGMETKDVTARFQAERQALAMMDHPNIARVLDAGSTDNGCPYFVMELVRGIPITEFCDQQKLTIRDRLNLFVAVCRAIQHAHQKGIIHRDIKPSNVLVTEHDGRPVPKVIDFGVAKAIGQRLADQSVYTHHLQPVGTFLYMSPEQSRLSGLDIDTRSDVYSLGLLLYELLTGALPFDRETFRKASFDEKRRIIAEEEAPRPSTRISSLGDSSASVSRSRQTEIVRLASELRGELDWILVKALDKDRNRRYESASRFAADVENFLNGEMVEAKPPTSAYRLKKFIRKNKQVATLAFAGVGILLIGLGVTSWLLDVKSRAFEVVRQQQYLSDMNAAVLAYEENDVQRANELLGRHSPEENETTDYRGKEWTYLKELCGRMERTSTIELESWAAGAAISPDRKLLVLPLYLKRVAMIDLVAKQVRFHVPENLEKDTRFAAFSSDSEHYLCPSPDGHKIRRGNVNSNGKVLEIFESPNEITTALFTGDDHYILGTSAGQLHIWELGSSHPIASYPIFGNDRVNSMARSHDGNIFACGLASGRLMVYRWMPESGNVDVLHDVQAHHQSINTVCFSPDDVYVLTGSTDTTIKIFDSEFGQEVSQLFGHQDDVRSIDFSPEDPNVFATAGRSREWKLWDFQSRSEIATLRGHSNGPVGLFTFRPDEYITEEGRELRFWSDVLRFRDTLAARSAVEDIALSRDGAVAVCMLGEKASRTVELRSTQHGAVLTSLAVESATSIALAPNDEVFVGDAAGWITRFDLRGRVISRDKIKTNSSVTALDVGQRSADSNSILAVGTENGVVEVFHVGRDLSPAWQSQAKDRHLAPIWDIAISTDGVVVSGDQNGIDRVWNILGENQGDFVEHFDSIRAVDFSPSRPDLVATAGYDGHVYVWNVKTRSVERPFEGDSDWMRDVKFLSDGNTLVTASGDGSIKFLDVRSGAQRIRFLGHEAAALCFALTPDDNMLISGGHDRIMRVYHAWQPSSGLPSW